MNGNVLITGASSGIGLFTLRRFAAAGWTATATVRNSERASQLEELLAEERIRATVVAFDVRDRQATDDAVSEILAGGVPDVLINNAAITVFAPIELLDDAAIDLQIETNVVAPLRLTRAFVPHFRQRGSGSIVHVASASGFVPQGCEGIYCASKHAVEALGEALYYEMRPFGVRVAIVEPGRTAADSDHKRVFAGGFGPDSPYWDGFMEEIGLLNRTLWKDDWAEDPAVVADAIFDAATATDRKLHWQVGRDTAFAATMRGRDALATYDERRIPALEAFTG